VVYAVEGPVNSAGSAIDWAQERLHLRVPADDLDTFFRTAGKNRRQVHFLPAVAGLGAPHWDASAQPRFAGDVRGASARELLLAVVESIAFRCAEIFRSAERTTGAANQRRPIVVAGGLTRCRTLVQAQADLLQREVLLSESADATARGAAILTLPARSGSIPRGPEGSGRLVRPRISRDEAESRFAAWAKAVYGAG
jgi:glycerol kinase